MTRTALPYWIVTAIVVGECVIGGAMDLLHLPPFYPMAILSWMARPPARRLEAPS
jgi:hypothetical protein